MRLDHIAYRVADRKKTARFDFGHGVRRTTPCGVPTIALPKIDSRADLEDADVGKDGEHVFMPERHLAVVSHRVV